MEEEFETEPTEQNEPEKKQLSVAEQLRTAREQQGLTHKQVSDKTRLPVRHVVTLEEGEYGTLPGTTYALGFARNYARALGLDEDALVQQLRDELHFDELHQQHFGNLDYAPADPARVPPQYFVWGAVAVLAIIIAAYALFRHFNSDAIDMSESAPFTSELNEPLLPADELTDEGTALGTDSGAFGPVVLTATDPIWLRIYDATGQRLYEDRMEKGDSYTVPADANNPMILTGRPQSLTVTVGGKEVAPLGEANKTIKDLPVSAEALMAREGEQTAAETVSTPATPKPGGSATTTSTPSASRTTQTTATPAAPTPSSTTQRTTAPAPRTTTTTATATPKPAATGTTSRTPSSTTPTTSTSTPPTRSATPPATPAATPAPDNDEEAGPAGTSEAEAE